jgi:hypothetical protein
MYPVEQKMIRRILMRLVHVGEDSEETRRHLDRTSLLEQLVDTEGALLRCRTCHMAVAATGQRKWRQQVRSGRDHRSRPLRTP